MRQVIFLLMLLVSFLSGCASAPERCDVRPIERTSIVNPGENESIIFGRILFTENGKSTIPYGFQTKPWWRIRSPPEYAGEKRIKCSAGHLGTQKDGTFVYIIPAGQYEVTHIRPNYYTPFIIPALKFSAEKPATAYYIGDLEIDYDSTRWLGGLWGNYIHHLNYLEVIDRYEQMQALVQDLIPLPVETNLMVRIRGQIPHLEEEQGGVPIMNFGTIQFGK